MDVDFDAFVRCLNKKRGHSHVKISYRVRHQIEVRECSPKIGTINIGLPCALGKKESMTSRTEYIHRVIPGQIRKTNW